MRYLLGQAQDEYYAIASGTGVVHGHMSIELIQDDSYHNMDRSFDFQETTLTDFRTVGGGGSSIYVVWAEESSPLREGSHQWSFGNGDLTPVNEGISIGVKSKLVSVTANVEGGLAEIAVYKNGSQAGKVNKDDSVEITDSIFEVGDVLNFKTVDVDGVTLSGRVAAWFQVSDSNFAPVESTGPELGEWQLLDTGVAGSTLSCRKFGRVVELSSRGVFTGSDTNIATLPEGYRPSDQVVFWSSYSQVIGSETFYSSAIISIESDGVVSYISTSGRGNNRIHYMFLVAG